MCVCSWVVIVLSLCCLIVFLCPSDVVPNLILCLSSSVIVLFVCYCVVPMLSQCVVSWFVPMLH